MTWEADALVEVEVRKGEWVAARVTEPGPHPRVQTLGGEKNVRPGPGKIRWPKAATSLRRALPPPSSDVAEVEAMEPVPASVVKQVARVTELRRVPKDITPRSRDHLAYVRELPCCHCGMRAPSEAHHFGKHGTGIKASDYETAPLCGACHDGFHQHGHLPGLDRVGTFAVFWEAAAKACAARLEEER